ncbi:MAG TPA: sialidase family protein, partial [Magnetospirillaceae bacterium]|nr:sialidase family protein [Magnetospirillaceae bacterium]
MTARIKSGAAALLLTAAAFFLGPGTAQAQEFYWETPRFLSNPSARYPAALEVPGGIAVLWQESQTTGPDAGEAFLSLVFLGDGQPEIVRSKFAGPFPFRGSEPVLFSASSSPGGELAVAVLTGEREVTVLISRDGGLTFPIQSPVASDQAISAPRIFPRSGGGWHLFTARGRDDDLSIYHAITPDGLTWTGFRPFVDVNEGLALSFLPSAASMSGVDVVAFQALSAGERPTFQIYAKLSSDGGASWSRASKVTIFRDEISGAGWEAFQNQRPHLAFLGGRLHITWERTPRAGAPQIYYAELDSFGVVVPRTSVRVSLGTGTAGDPRLLDVGGAPGVVWFDNRRGRNHVYLAVLEGRLWRERDLSVRGESTFGRSIYREGRIWAFWQSHPAAGGPRITALEPDTTIRPPTAAAVDFTEGRRTRRDTATVRWTVPEDSSGIAGFSYTWSQDPGREPPEALALLETVDRITVAADRDGSWWFSVRAVDYAGNWSGPVRVEFVRDKTPPGAPVLRAPESGTDGFLLSNTFTILWDAPADPDLIGYTWTLRYLGPLDRLPARRRPVAQPAPAEAAGPYPFEPVTDFERQLVSRAGDVLPPPAPQGTAASAGFRNVDDGYYIFAVAAVDMVGNIGPAVRTILRADRFIPFTHVSDILVSRDDFGLAMLRILGRGFREDGPVSRVVMDRDGQAPFDYNFELAAGNYSVDSDRLIGGLAAGDMEEGEYRIGLLHPARGWYWARSTLSFDAAGTVKFGDFTARYKPVWTFRP